MDLRERAFERKKMYFLHYMKKFINIRFYVPTLVPRESDSTVDQPPECFKMKETDWGVLKTFFCSFLAQREKRLGVCLIFFFQTLHGPSMEQKVLNQQYSNLKVFRLKKF